MHRSQDSVHTIRPTEHKTSCLSVSRPASIFVRTAQRGPLLCAPRCHYLCHYHSRSLYNASGTARKHCRKQVQRLPSIIRSGLGWTALTAHQRQPHSRQLTRPLALHRSSCKGVFGTSDNSVASTTNQERAGHGRHQ
ncbi:Uncharacterized protein HZ326_1702 [Fusarium oxysporum f. sp. albedinis]|nr:Uncharacterized protein HZ326_1702 [Fusarium oxysporum f. sp. albedinis]